MIGLCGAHRTGKTTLAREFSKVSGIPFVQTSASGVFAAMGLDPKVDYPLAQRIEIQRRILDACMGQYRSVENGIFVTDRTPVDMAAYMLADIQRQTVQRLSETTALDNYITDCIEATNAMFSILVVVQPGIAVVEEEGKAPATPAYVEHINALVLGLVVSDVIEAAHYHIPRSMKDLGKRVKAVDFAIRKTNERFQNHQEALVNAGTPMVFH